MNDEHIHAHLMHEQREADEPCDSRLMAEQRAWAQSNRAWIDAEWDALTIPPRTIAQHLAGGLDPRLAAEWEA